MLERTSESRCYVRPPIFSMLCQTSLLVRTPSCDLKFGESALVAMLLGFIIDWVYEMGSQKRKNVSFVKNIYIKIIRKGYIFREFCSTMGLNHGTNLVCPLRSLPCAASKHERLPFLFPGSKSSLTSFGFFLKSALPLCLGLCPRHLYHCLTNAKTKLSCKYKRC